MEWQPIETAPKTYEDILLIDKRGTQVVGSWDEEENEFTCDYRGKGNFNWVFATHWMPLPAPPTV